jgi:toxin ParE1/3/4
MREIQNSFQMLHRRPGLGRARPEFGPNHRSRLVGRHVVFYRSENESVVILRILHQSMDVTAKL